jgi:putative ubiquitin-RnfH superfamily antitoxin RatB of RatAB toxin-antitoxin module
MAADDKVAVEVAYELPDEQILLALELPAGSTVADAVAASGIVERFPEIDPAAAKLGVFGKHVTRDRVLRSGDRVEIYRPLLADPKERRRKRAAKGQTMRDEASGEEGP